MINWIFTSINLYLSRLILGVRNNHYGELNFVFYQKPTYQIIMTELYGKFSFILICIFYKYLLSSIKQMLTLQAESLCEITVYCIIYSISSQIRQRFIDFYLFMCVLRACAFIMWRI